MSTNEPDIEALRGLSGSQQPPLLGSPLMTELERLAGEGAPYTSPVASETAPPSAVQDIAAPARATADTTAAQEVRKILVAANIDPDNALTKDWMTSLLGDTPRQQLASLRAPGAQISLQGFLHDFPEVALTQTTPYTEFLAGAGFLPAPAPVGISHIPPSQAPPPETGYEVSDETGAIRFANGTIVTEGGGITFDPSRTAPGSDGYLRIAAGWDEAKLEEWKSKLVTYGYLSKDDAKTPGFTTEFRSALQSYWTSYYVNGGRPIASAEGASGATLPDPIDYKEYVASASNTMREQLRSILGIEPTEAQVRAQVQYVLRTASELQTKFRKKGNRGNLGTQYDQATEQAIANIETSPYAQDVRENTQLHDSLANAAAVSRSLLS